MVHWPIDQNSMAHFSGTHTAAGGRDYASTGDVAADAVPPARKVSRLLNDSHSAASS
jgi:hypothetical protein